MARGFHVVAGSYPHLPEKINFKIGNADHSGFTKEKWLASIAKWKKFIYKDSQKNFFQKKLTNHMQQLIYAKELLTLLKNDQHQGIVNKIEQTEISFINPIFAKKVLLPLGKQAKGVLESQQQPGQDLRSTPVDFTDNDFPMCSIL